MPSAAGAITYDVDCQNLGEAPGVPLTRRSPIEYSTYDLATLSRRLAAPRRAAPRRPVGVNAEMHVRALHQAEPRVTLRGVVRLSLRRDDFQDVCPLEAREPLFYCCLIRATGR